VRVIAARLLLLTQCRSPLLNLSFTPQLVSSIWSDLGYSRQIHRLNNDISKVVAQVDRIRSLGGGGAGPGAGAGAAEETDDAKKVKLLELLDAMSPDERKVVLGRHGLRITPDRPPQTAGDAGDASGASAAPVSLGGKALAPGARRGGHGWVSRLRRKAGAGNGRKRRGGPGPGPAPPTAAATPRPKRARTGRRFDADGSVSCVPSDMQAERLRGPRARLQGTGGKEGKGGDVEDAAAEPAERSGEAVEDEAQGRQEEEEKAAAEKEGTNVAEEAAEAIETPDKANDLIRGTIGWKLAKAFEGKYWEGTVTGIVEVDDAAFAHVEYTDGDEEDLAWEELRPLVYSYARACRANRPST
jgi:hypothetical protein